MVRTEQQGDTTSPRPLLAVDVRAAVGALLDEEVVGVVVLDRDGRILWANARARDFLAGERALEEREGRLAAVSKGQAAALDRRLRAAVRGAEGGLAVVGKWPEVRPLMVYANPLRPVPRQRASTRGRAPAAVATIVDPWNGTPVDRERVAAALGLTPAQSLVAAKLAEGMTVRQIAEATNRSEPTVRSLVKGALARTYCHRQADLVRLALSASRLPPPRSESAGSEP